MIEVVFFDFDGVLNPEKSGMDATSSKLAELKGLPYDQLRQVFRTHVKPLLLAPGKYEDVLDDISADVGSVISIDDVRAAIMETPRNEGMLEIAGKLRKKGISTGIITDNTVERMRLLSDKFGFDSFKPVVISAETACTKYESTNIFEVALELANVNASDALFIDNSKQNLVYAEQLGMHTYWHDESANDLQALRNYLSELSLLTPDS